MFVQTYNPGNKSWVKRSIVTGKIIENSPDPFPDIPKQSEKKDQYEYALVEEESEEKKQSEDERSMGKNDAQESGTFFEWD